MYLTRSNCRICRLYSTLLVLTVGYVGCSTLLDQTVGNVLTRSNCRICRLYSTLLDLTVGYVGCSTLLDQTVGYVPY